MSTPLLALKLKELRLQHNYTQKYVGYYLNMSRGGYAQYEIDARTPSIEMLLKLSQLYQVGIDTFINSETIPLTDTVQDCTSETTQNLREESNFDYPSIELKQLRILGNLLLHASPSVNMEELSQEDINFLGSFKSLPLETQEDIKLFCSCKLKKFQSSRREN